MKEYESAKIKLIIISYVVLDPFSQKNLQSDRNRKYISGAKMRFTKSHNIMTLKAGVCRPCVETKITATKKSATDGN